MNIPSQQNVAQRWETLAPQLRESFFSEPNDDFIEKLCQSEHLPQNKIDGVFSMVSYALLGFMHPEDLADELVKTVGMPAPAAASIANGVSQRIFSPLKEYLGAALAPVSKFEVGPKIIQDIGPAPAAIREEVRSGPITISTVPMPGLPKTAPSQPPAALSPLAASLPNEIPAPASISAPPTGWSRATSSPPIVRLSQTPAPAASITPPASATVAAQPKIAPPPIQTSPKAAMDEFERLRLSQKTSPNPAPTIPSTRVVAAAQEVPTSPAAPAPSAPLPPPVMIHEDTQFKPQSPEFRFETASKPIDMGSKASVIPPPSRPAVLEFGPAGAPAAPKPGPATTRVVHYKDYSADDASASPANKQGIAPLPPSPPPPGK